MNLLSKIRIRFSRDEIIHTDKKLSVLDVKIWIETEESNKLLHEYYQKTVASSSGEESYKHLIS